MKLMWFHLMPCTELPDDFRDKHPSVWVDIRSALFDPKRARHMYNAGHLMLLRQFGNMSKELTKRNTRLFAQRVMAAAQRAVVPALWPELRAAE
jgi:hypothetical protein